MPVVQRAHGGHQPDHPAGGTGPVQQVAAGGDGLDDLHRRLPYTAAGCAGTVTAGCAGTVAAGGAGTGASAWASRVARAAPA